MLNFLDHILILPSDFLSALPILIFLMLSLISLCLSCLYDVHRTLVIVSLLILAVLLLINVIALDILFMNDIKAKLVLFEIANFKITLAIDCIGLIFLNIISLLWPGALIYTIGFIEINNIKNPKLFLSLISLNIVIANLIALSANLMTMFIAYEMLSIASAPLIAYDGTKKAKEALTIYLRILLSISTLLFLPSIIIIYNKANFGDFNSIGFISLYFTDTQSFILIFALVFGIAKAAVLPFHLWLPASMGASYPVSALLHAVVVVKAGLFCLIKIMVYTFGVDYLANLFCPNNYLSYLFITTIIYSSIKAVKNRNIKTILAYSTISHLSLCLLSFSLFTSIGLSSCIIHITSHALTKILLFFVAGYMYSYQKAVHISDLNGTSRSMPIVSFIFLLAALSLMGIPPLAGFISKFYILTAALKSQNLSIIFTIIFSSICTSYYLGKIIVAIYKAPSQLLSKTFIKAPSKFMLFGLSYLTILLVLFPFAPGLISSTIYKL